MALPPYVVGQWVRAERFYGRRALIEEILQGPRNALWLLGTRRIGKTSVLKQLEHLALTEAEWNSVPVFWDFQGATDAEELRLGFGDSLLDSEEHLARCGIELASVEQDDLFRTIAALRRALRAKGKRLLLLCDEVEELLTLNEREPSLLAKLRRALQAGEDIRAVLASTIKLWELSDQRGNTSPFLNGFTPPLYIHNLAPDEARALILQANLPSESRPRIDDRQAEIIRSRCDSHPYLIQLLCKRFLELGDLDAAVEQVATDSMVRFFFSVDFEMLSELERRILRIVDDQRTSTSNTIQKRMAIDGSALNGCLQRLQHLGYVRRNREGSFELVNYFFSRWFRENADDEGSSAGHDAPTHVSGDADPKAVVGLQKTLDSRYELLHCAGRGATGSVYKAHDTLLRADVAIKLLKPEYTAADEAVERLRREVLLARDLSHPNIVKTYHLGNFDGRKYVTMEWVEGPTLQRVIGERAPLPLGEAVRIARRVAEALASAHGCRVLHRDIKPHNILIDARGEPRVTDFGLARLVGEAEVTAHGTFLGTPDYASPEQASMAALDGRSDVYSLGVVLFEMVTGRLPFEGDSPAEVLAHHRLTAPPDPAALRPDLPDTLARLILACLEKEPDRRIAGAHELARALERVSGEIASGPDAPDRRERVDAGAAAPAPAGHGDDGLEQGSASGSENVPAAGATGAGSDVSQLLRLWSDGDPKALDRLMPMMYDELRRLARSRMRHERADHTLQTTAVVNEAYLRLCDQERVSLKHRGEFQQVAAQTMRRVLVDHARRRLADKRGAGVRLLPLDEQLDTTAPDEPAVDVVALDEALERLAVEQPRRARVVEMRFFGGLNVNEVAESLGISRATVKREWSAARAWLRKALSG